MPTIEPLALSSVLRAAPRRKFSAAGWVWTLMAVLALAACGSDGQQANGAVSPSAGGSSTGPSASGPGRSPAAVRSSPGPAASASYQVPAGGSTHKISVGGVERTFLTYRPAGLPPRAPLVVMLHPALGSGSQAERDYHWDAEADRGHFLVAYPNGLNASWGAGGGCCGASGLNHVDDIAFISAMVSAIESENPIDRNRVYATGISQGGVLAYALACRTRIFAAIGPDSATEIGTCHSPAPVSIIHIHGTADPVIPYSGHSAMAQIFDGPGIPALNATWRQIDHCAVPAITTVGQVTTSVAACPSGRAVELVTIAGASHQWPGAVPDLGPPPSTALNATQVIWGFFAEHQL